MIFVPHYGTVVPEITLGRSLKCLDAVWNDRQFRDEISVLIEIHIVRQVKLQGVNDAAKTLCRRRR